MKNPKEKAFTLVELLIVIAIIAILSVAFLPNVLNAPKKARDVVRIKTISNIAGAIEAFSAERGGPPTSSTGTTNNCFTDLVAGKKLGIVVPKDDKKFNSCFTRVEAEKDKYFYRNVVALTTPISAPVSFYVIGVRLENSASANAFESKVGRLVFATKVGGNCRLTATNLGGNYFSDCAKNIIGILSAGNYTIPWYIVVGPK